MEVTMADALMHNLQADGYLISFHGSNWTYQKGHTTDPTVVSDDSTMTEDEAARGQAVKPFLTTFNNRAIETGLPLQLSGTANIAQAPFQDTLSDGSTMRSKRDLRLNCRATDGRERSAAIIPVSVLYERPGKIRELHPSRLDNSQTEPVITSTAASKKAKIKKERLQGKPDAKKWDWIYRLIFECAPSSTTRHSLRSQSAILSEEKEPTLGDFEKYVTNELPVPCDPDSLLEYQACVTAIAKFRGRWCQSRSSETSEVPAVPSLSSSGSSPHLSGCSTGVENLGEDVSGGFDVSCIGAWQPMPDIMVDQLVLPDEAGQLVPFGGTNWSYCLPQSLPRTEFEADVIRPEAEQAHPLEGWENEFGLWENAHFSFQ
ncbi:hypothetical protein CMUS01_06013 [Colletotrichum musicola]|uniref:Uncharacterized protein n=1 Tax=Colletotrichum musicola TaxID=2175873 RepID=A0A8H6NIQ0_9PEZI|nr:hypothetical protein CMUS01_06013 [Colletotrichum musicola]